MTTTLMALGFLANFFFIFLVTLTCLAIVCCYFLTTASKLKIASLATLVSIAASCFLITFLTAKSTLALAIFLASLAFSSYLLTILLAYLMINFCVLEFFARASFFYSLSSSLNFAIKVLCVCFAFVFNYAARHEDLIL